MTPRRRYAQVGIGVRSMFFTEALVKDYRESSQLVALCDTNPGRLRQRAEWIRQQGSQVKTYRETEFDRMIAETKPDAVIITTPDWAHDIYICRAMELGVDVISEKAMTIDERRCQRILDTHRRTGRSCQVTFNYRYAPPNTQLKDLLMSGVIGNVLSVDFHWLLDTSHGADYFRRWHRNKANSGGLQVHKATHHFDLINWWLSTVPEQVYATGGRTFYTPQTANRYGLANRTERCLTCGEQSRCPFFLNLQAYSDLSSMYLENEQYDGYFRDRCVFGSDIDIEDTLHVIINYQNGVSMNYSLHAFMPWEGYIVSFNGSKGRLEHITRETAYISGDGAVPGELLGESTSTWIFPHFQAGYQVEVWKGEGGHGGGDPAMLDHLFGVDPAPDPYLRAADQRAGAWSILVGAAINQSLARGCPIRLDELVQGLEEPEYPPMPSSTEPIDLRS